MREVPGSNPGRAQNYFWRGVDKTLTIGLSVFLSVSTRSHGVMVSTLDSESSDPSSNLGGTSSFLKFFFLPIVSQYAVLMCPVVRQIPAVIAQLGER